MYRFKLAVFATAVLTVSCARSYIPIPQPSSGLVSLTFDDGWRSGYEVAIPLLEQHGFKATFYLPSWEKNQLTRDEVLQIKKAGYEIASHGLNHLDLTTLQEDQLVYELVESKRVLEEVVGPINNFATPFCTYNEQIIIEIRKIYQSHRSCGGGLNSRDALDVYNIKSVTITSGTTLEELQALLNQASRDQSWLVLTYHKIDNSGGLYSTTEEEFASHLRLIADSDPRVVTVEEALTMLTSQD